MLFLMTLRSPPPPLCALSPRMRGPEVSSGLSRPPPTLPACKLVKIGVMPSELGSVSEWLVCSVGGWTVEPPGPVMEVAEGCLGFSAFRLCMRGLLGGSRMKLAAVIASRPNESERERRPAVGTETAPEMLLSEPLTLPATLPTTLPTLPATLLTLPVLPSRERPAPTM